MFKNKWLKSAVFVGWFVVSVAAHADSRAFFVEPKDGATVSNPVHIVFGVEGMKVAPAGLVKPGEGHHHLIIGGGPMAKGQAIPADETHIHYGKAQTEASIELPAGEHTLTTQFADGMHLSYGPGMSQTIKIHVKKSK
jgi:hypothetical protein